jgi:hypothetical protein
MYPWADNLLGYYLRNPTLPWQKPERNYGNRWYQWNENEKVNSIGAHKNKPRDGGL